MKYLLFCLLILSACRNTPKENLSCHENATSEKKLFAFVGERIAVKALPVREYVNEPKFVAEYEIIERLCGDYEGDSIKFDVVDFIVDSSFKKSKHILAFLVKSKVVDEAYWMPGAFYFDVYKTKDGQWASPHRANYFSKYIPKESLTIGPRKIAFAQEVSFDLNGMDKEEIDYLYPAPYYKIQGNKAVAIYGNYADELVQLQKTGVLRSWGMFGTPDTSIKEVELEPINIPKT